MNAATGKVVEAMSNDILALCHLILETDKISNNIKIKKGDKNTLRDSALNENISSSVSYFGSGDVVIKSIFDNYINYIEWDRPKEYGKQPPIDSLKDWASSRDIPTDNSTLFSIARAIWRDGHVGRPILATLGKEIEESFNSEVSGALFNAIINELIKYFN